MTWVLYPKGFPNELKQDGYSSLPLQNDQTSTTPILGAKHMFMHIERVTALPAVLTPSAMYIVKATEAGLAEVYFSNSDGTEARHVINKTEINAMISTQLTNFSNIQVVADITARDALNPTRNILALALDAAEDTTVTAGAALYVFDDATDVWHKVSEFESLDVVLQWDAIQGRPSSTVAQIDDAVSKAHTHANKAQLDKIGEDAEGNFQYNGAYIDANIAVSDW